MKKDSTFFVQPPTIDDDSLEVVATIQTSTKDSPSKIRLLCSNCNKGIHNTKLMEHRCKGKTCECICQWWYEGLDGRLRKRGTPDNSFEEKPYKVNRQLNAKIDKLNQEWRALQKELVQKK